MKGSLCRLAETSFLWRDTAMRIRERFNPRAPCGARRHRSAKPLVSSRISTHAPLAGRDPCRSAASPSGCPFQPTRPLRGATACARSDTEHITISTHAPLAGRDDDLLLLLDRVDISTHAPLAGRDRKKKKERKEQKQFQPTRPLRGATYLPVGASITYEFQPTRPLRGATLSRLRLSSDSV